MSVHTARLDQHLTQLDLSLPSVMAHLNLDDTPLEAVLRTVLPGCSWARIKLICRCRL